MRPLHAAGRFVRKLLGRVICGLGMLVPRHPRQIVVSSFPDFDDNAKCIQEEAVRLGFEVTILTSGGPCSRPGWVVAKVVNKFSLLGLWKYFRAKFVFYTHGLYSFMPVASNQCVVNLWHGMPIKRIGLLDPLSTVEVPRFTLAIASNEKFKDVLAASFGVPKQQVLVADAPRLDLIEGICATPPQLPPHRLLGVWLPTYRVSRIGDVRVDGNPEEDIFSPEMDLSPLDDLFGRFGIICLAKPHPMARVPRQSLDRYRHFRYFDDSDLANWGLTLYECLGFSDFLITDLSSVYFDYKPIGRPIYMFCPDFRAFEQSRGFTLPIQELVDQPILDSLVDLAAEMERDLTAGRIQPSVRTPAREGGRRTQALLAKLGMACPRTT